MQELERCEKMLHAQTNINRELALEIEDLTSKTVSASSVLQKRIKGLELLAEERQQQILQLEAQVRQLKYAREKLLQKSRDSDGELNMDGSSDDESSDVESIPESLIMAAGDLAPGEQLLELLIVSGTFDRNVVSENSSTFILCDFYDFESQTTPLLMGNRPEYSFSSTFKVTVDGFFLRYLASETLILEVHQATRGDFKLIGRAFIRLSTLLQSRGVLKEHTLPVKSTHTHNDGQVIGTLNFVLRLSCPISEIWRLHLRSYPQDVQLLALEKKSSSQMSTADFLLDADEGGMEKHQVNELQITVFGCKRLRSYGHKKGNSLSRIPSSYVHYQLLGFPDVFTNIAPESANPEYDLEYSRQTFVMEIDACLLRFFSKFRLWLTVFDDQIELDGDSKDDGMIGRCGVLLSELANGESIRGWFPLLDRGDHSAGEISVLIQWKDPFQILQFVSSRRARGGIDRPTDLHVLDFDQQHAVMKLLSPDMDGRINYKQFLNYCLPSEPLELITAKTKERFEYAIDTQQISSVEEAFKGSRETSRESGRIPIAGCVLVMEKYGIFLSDTEMDVLKESFGPIRGNRADSESASQNYVVLHFLLQHINPRMSCSSRLLMHKLRHTVRGFLQQQQKKSKSSEFLSPARVFEQFDSNLSGQVSRAEFKRCLSVFGFELVDVEKEYAALVAVPHVKQEPVVSKEKDEKEPAKVKELDLDAEILVDTKSASHQMPTQPQRTINVSDTKTKDAAKTFNQASAAPSPTGEFQRRKQAFMDRMKAIASASSKSLVYEQLEKRHDQQRRTEESTARIAEMPRLDLINQQAARLQTPSSIHHDAAKTVQHQYRMHRDSKRQTEYAKRCSILSADLQLQKIFKRWTCGELETLQDELVGKIEAEIPEAKKTHMVSRKQFGFLLSQFPRVAIDPALLSQLMEYFSISPTNPKSVVAYHSLIHFICSISTEERVEEQVHHHTVLKVLEDICLVSPHALDTFVSVGDMNNTGSISFRRFQEALQRLGVNMPSKDLRVVMTLFDCNGIELLYHAFLHMIEQSPRSFQLKQVVSRCQRFGVSKLKERLLMYMNSIDGSMTRQDLQYLFMQESNEFVQFDPKDARVLFEMINADSEAGKIPINALIARLENAIKNGNGMEMREMGKYSMHKLRRLARNCRKLTCDTHAYLIAQFERFDWREQGVVSLDEFVAVAQQNGFQVLTPLQLKQIAKCFGAKLRGQFGINYRQFLDWTNPPPTIDIEEIETKLRRFAHAQAEQVTSKKVTKVLSNWQQVLASADTMKHKVLTRATFAEVVKIKLDLPLSDEEIRVVLYSYDRALEDQVDYEGFVQLNWGAASKAYADRKQVHFGKQVIPTVEVVQKIKTALKDSKKSGVSVLNAFKDASGGHNGFVDALAFVQGMKKVNVALTMDETLSVLAVYGESPDRNKLDYQKFAKDVLGLPFGRTGGHPEVVLKEEDEQRLTAAIVSAMTYSRGAFQQSFLQFQEFCVVRRFSEIGTNTFWKHMESNGLVEILSRRGVGLLSQKFLVQCEPDKKQVSREDEQVSQEVISLKAVHSYLQEFLQNDATTALGSPMKQRAQSQNGREESGFSAMDSLRKLLSHCSDIGLDARGCFEKIDSQYSGYVTAMDMKQILLGLGISKFAQKTAPEAIIGHLVRQFRSTDSHDAVSYTLMLYEAFAFKPLSPELEWYARTSEHLRARIRLKADFSGKIDFGNPCIYRQLDACFAHFDRDRKGFLTPACLREGLASLKYELTDAQLQQLITQMGVYRNGTNSVSRMEFDSFALDPYAFSLLKNLAQDLYVSDRDQRGEIIPRIAQLSYAVMSHDNVEPKGVLSRQSFWTCLEDVLEKKLTQFAKFSLQHLFELKRDGMIAYKLFLKVTAQWRKSSLDCASLPKNPRTAELAHSIPRSERESIEKGDIRCSYQDLLQCLMRQLSTVDFYSQVDIVDEYLRRKDWQHTGTIKLKHLMRTFDQVGLSLSKDAIASLESYFAVNGDEKVIMYEKLIDALKALYEVTCEKNDEEEADAQRKRSSRDTHREHK
uniref:Calmodulin n=1 Tax=Globisporangium ultimum (strain ATCC 200006 / CBS 805.95 / DAOM BR144) TaxID=431595 RepID=K3WS03_GLOUD